MRRSAAAGLVRARRAAAAALAGGLSLHPAVSAAAGGSPAVSTPAPVQTVLSDMRALTRWAYPQAEAAAHQDPSDQSRVLGRLHFLTPDGQAEVAIALRSYSTEGRTWILVPLPGRPNGTTGWVPREALGGMHVTRDFLRVDREGLRATLYRSGRPIWSAPVGVGRPALPTPVGHFYVTEKLEVVGAPSFGPYAIGTSAYAPTLTEWPGGGVVGIHGTDQPQLIPGRPSHGCIRLRNSDITRLWRLIHVGTPIEIV